MSPTLWVHVLCYVSMLFERFVIKIWIESHFLCIDIYEDDCTLNGTGSWHIFSNSSQKLLNLKYSTINTLYKELFRTAKKIMQANFFTITVLSTMRTIFHTKQKAVIFIFLHNKGRVHYKALTVFTMVSSKALYDKE